MSVTPISMVQVQGALQQSKRRFGATHTSTVVDSTKIGRFEALLREPQQVADTMASREISPQSLVETPFVYFGLENAQQSTQAGMNLQNVSQLATLVNISSVDPTVFSNALSMLTESAERNQLKTVEAPALSVQGQNIDESRTVADIVKLIAEAAESVQKDTTIEKSQIVNSVEQSAVQARGSLAAMFESGGTGNLAAIGYDATGGTSYGKYQFSSRRGTMDGFLTYLDRYASDISLHLRAAGDVNTGSRAGEMPNAWKEVAAIDPVRFESMQNAFMESRFYKPAAAVIQNKMNIEKLSPAMEEVLLSTSLQHGPSGAVQIFAKAYSNTGGYSEALQTDFIKNIYALRKNEFATSSSEVRTNVQNRLERELGAALSLLA